MKMGSTPGSGNKIIKYQVSTGKNAVTINKTKGEVRRGKDGKMYVAANKEKELKVIENPDGVTSITQLPITTGSWHLSGSLPLQVHKIHPKKRELFSRFLDNPRLCIRKSERR